MQALGKRLESPRDSLDDAVPGFNPPLPPCSSVPSASAASASISPFSSADIDVVRKVAAALGLAQLLPSVDPEVPLKQSTSKSGPGSESSHFEDGYFADMSVEELSTSLGGGRRFSQSRYHTISPAPDDQVPPTPRKIYAPNLPVNVHGFGFWLGRSLRPP